MYGKVNQLYIYCPPPLFFGFPSHLGRHRALSIAPSAIQEALISYVFWLCVSSCFSREEHVPGDTCSSVLKVLYPAVLIHPSCHAWEPLLQNSHFSQVSIPQYYLSSSSILVTVRHSSHLSRSGNSAPHQCFDLNDAVRTLF